MLPDLTRPSEVLPGSLEHVPREGQPPPTGLRQLPGRPGPGRARRRARPAFVGRRRGPERGRTSVPAPCTQPALRSLRPAAGTPAGTGPLLSPAAAPSSPPGVRSAAAAGRAHPGRGGAGLPTASARRCRGCGGAQPGCPRYSPHGYPASPWRRRDPAPPPAAASAQPRALPRAQEAAAPLGPSRPRSCGSGGSGDGGGHTAPPAGAAPGRPLAASARPALPGAARRGPGAAAAARAPRGRNGRAGGALLHRPVGRW